MNIMICGSRDATPKMLEYAKKAALRAAELGYSVVVGDAPGVDAQVIRTLDALGYEKIVVCGAYNKLRNKTAVGENRAYSKTYTQRDDEMISLSDMVLCIWDGSSRGTERNYHEAIRLGKQAWLKRP